MSTGKILRIRSTSSAQTEALAARLASNLHGGEIIELVSDLGGGKTTFVRGFASGLGSADKVSSPTFKISNEYATPKFIIYHFDFYRLPEAGIIADELAEIIGDPSAIIVVEWADVVQDVLPPEHLKINIKTVGENERRLELSYPESLAYMVEDLAK